MSQQRAQSSEKKATVEKTKTPWSSSPASIEYPLTPMPPPPPRRKPPVPVPDIVEENPNVQSVVPKEEASPKVESTSSSAWDPVTDPHDLWRRKPIPGLDQELQPSREEGAVEDADCDDPVEHLNLLCIMLVTSQCFTRALVFLCHLIAEPIEMPVFT